MEIPHGYGLMVVPSVSQQHAYRIVALLQVGGDVVGHIEVAPVEARVERIQPVVAHTSPVEVELIEACHGYIGSGRAYRLRGTEGVAEVGSRTIAGIVPVANPGSLPTALLHHACLKGLHLGRMGFPLRIP